MTSNKAILILLFFCLTAGLAPYTPEPHLFGKIKWIMGGADGMKFMDYLDLLMHGLPWVLLIYALFKKFTTPAIDLSSIVNQNNVNIIDVREPNEIKSGMVTGAINMPLSSFGQYIPQIKEMTGPTVLYCRSGMRSGRAMSQCKKAGITEVYNGGGYAKMQSIVKK